MSDITVREEEKHALGSLLDKVRSYAIQIGLGNAPAGTTHQEELRYYFTKLMFGASVRLETIAATLRNHSSDELKAVVAVEQPEISKELRACSDIFHILFPSPNLH